MLCFVTTGIQVFWIREQARETPNNHVEGQLTSWPTLSTLTGSGYLSPNTLRRLWMRFACEKDVGGFRVRSHRKRRLVGLRGRYHSCQKPNQGRFPCSLTEFRSCCGLAQLTFAHDTKHTATDNCMAWCGTAHTTYIAACANQLKIVLRQQVLSDGRSKRQMDKLTCSSGATKA